MAPEWEAVDLGMGLAHHHMTSTNNTAMPPAPSMNHYFYGGGGGTPSSSFNLSFADDFSIPAVPSEEAAELEWLSNFVDDSYPDVPSYYPPEAMAAAAQQQPPPASVVGSCRTTKRSRPTTSQRSKNKLPAVVAGAGGDDYASNINSEEGARRCTHCASEKTPQWRTGPLGPKTLCNACGVRYKSGRLVPEYRPAASPTFVLTQHSNSHRKVMELRRQKELIHLHGTSSSPSASSSSSSSAFRDYGVC